MLGKTGQGQGFFSLERRIDQYRQRVQALGHVVAVFELFQRCRHNFRFATQAQVRQRNVLQAAAGEMLIFGHIGRDFRHFTVGLVTRPQLVKQAVGQLLARKLARRVNGIDIGHFADFGQVGFTRQRQHLGHHRLIQLRVGQHAAQGFATLILTNQRLQDLHRQLLTRIPTVETVGVVLHQEHQLVTAVGKLQLHRRRETAQQGRQRFFIDTDKGERLFCFGHRQNTAGADRRRFAGQLQRQLGTLGIQQSQLDRDHERQLFNFVRGLRAALGESQAVGFLLSVVMLADSQTRGARLAVPALELAEVRAIGVLHGLDKVVAGHGLAVVAFKVQVAALAKALGAEQGLQHAHHFRALFINGQGVEVGDFDKALRAHGVSHRACVFGELVRAQERDVLNALDNP